MTLVHLLDEHHVPGKRLGRHVHHDPRSRDFPAVELVTPDAPVTSKLWRFPGKPLDQDKPKPLGSCTGNATAHLLRVRRGRAAGLTEATARGIYSLATQLDPIPGYWKPRDPQAQDTGSDGLDALKAAQQLGLFTGAYRWCFGLSDVLRVLSQHGPVIIGIPWYEGFDQPSSDGTVTIAGSVRGGHEVCVLGVDAEAKTIRLVNSWGSSWADHGFFTMGWDTLDQLLHDNGDAATVG